MARIKGIDLPKNKRGVIGLTYIYGIGLSYSKSILKEAKVSEDIKVQDWTDDQTNAIRSIIADKYIVEGELRAESKMNIKRLMDIGCYRGIRHRMGLPLRGQKTKNNSRTRKGKRKTVANKKK
tara:strand:+ start:1402 stop:1770 length:369 start_codon:yes stop_codon:yes gene_type:complete